MRHLTRQLAIPSVDSWIIRIAFASVDLRVVDQHFGSSPRLAIYGIRRDEVQLLEVADFTVLLGHSEDKLTSRVNAVEGCFTLYCTAIGDTAFRRLLAIGVRAVNVARNTPIAVLLADAQALCSDGGIKKSLRKKDRGRFDAMMRESSWYDEE
ncbi:MULTISPECIES: NifB/NifX family molybdenum-iron cluster-binding protein [Brenneria]|uniref:Nitrogen fixation protein NifX n=1 Tax=Brenneria nigrifluens DSM 30175 = ATCC 13028 TaxID=1121120 RepID=A0A2U1UCI2_9GAMM|nr:MULTISPECIES: NifB/NifX family molybdenum-iron cluster-binding protein [Brenneria]EHD21374.1 Dinitrogenase iron-molybdenum cofactor biosynthesis protein [Brenneria sp. EniD312]PWC19373.1 nitrogen fixation protein NifX [Brenneria nigrifluens DSM 30175 = ATCC 13028]PWC20099.1 nitrogen fixation protein NifX [Brenneria nigrifluens DSM 30175 = ATCC 13028]QCR04504.1 nitrogen fixation protein NifX [Brenneria nigrifluens DSM 30175 = ATCC 13028]